MLVYKAGKISSEIFSIAILVLVAEVWEGGIKYRDYNSGLNFNPGLALTQL